MNGIIVSSIGQADDTVLLSDCLVKLYGLLHLAVQYCQQYHVELVPEKTKLLAFAPSTESSLLDIQKLYNPLKLGNLDIGFSNSGEHVRILRSTEGNMPIILDYHSPQVRELCEINKSNRLNRLFIQIGQIV